jgi:hypothetical protein
MAREIRISITSGAWGDSRGLGTFFAPCGVKKNQVRDNATVDDVIGNRTLLFRNKYSIMFTASLRPSRAPILIYIPLLLP